MAMKHGSKERDRRPYDEAALEQAALNYAARFATTRRKLSDYLRRKLREHGWEGEADPPVERLVERLARLGYVDDRGFARGRAAALLRRGYGERRIDAALRAAGVDEADIEVAEDGQAGWEAALKLAERRRIGPFAADAADRAGRERAMAILIRAGHPPSRARRIAAAPPGVVPAWDES